MTDIFSPRKRSCLMASIRGSGNKSTELRLVRFFRRLKITGWRRGSQLPGKPDFVFADAKLAIFVDGCFWHGCPDHCTWPKSNRRFWKRKIDKNKTRDTEVTAALRAIGWTVCRIWEHDLKGHPESKALMRVVRIISKRLLEM